MEQNNLFVYGPEDYSLPFSKSFAQNLRDSLIRGGDKIAQISGESGEKVTYYEIIQKSVNFAASLKKLGIKKGDIVSISSENRFEFTVCTIGSLLLGVIVAPINVLYSGNEVIHALRISKPKIIICSPFTVYQILDVLEKTPYVQKVILMSSEKPNESVLLYQDLIKENVDVKTFKYESVDLDTHPLCILYSSGTTGLPKGVLLSHKNFLVCAEHLRALTEEAKCTLTLIPWFHAYGFVTHLVTLYVQAKYVFLTRFEEEQFLRSLQDYKVTLTYTVPPLMVFLAKHPLVDKFDLSNLQEIWCGAAPLSKDLQISVMERIGVKSIKQGYGLTETTLAAMQNGLPGSVIKYGSCGQVVPGSVSKVVDIETGEALGPNKRGEICFKGPLTMLGYIGDTQATNCMFDSDGFLHTGDIGYYDDEKYFFIVDRLKELIKYKGFQVPPAELEALLLQHPDVKDVGVVGIPDEQAGELPIAFIVLQPGSKITEKEIIDFVAKNLSYHKRLHGGVKFVDEIPKNPSGKILRRELKELIKTLPKSKL